MFYSFICVDYCACAYTTTLKLSVQILQLMTFIDFHATFQRKVVQSFNQLLNSPNIHKSFFCMCLLVLNSKFLHFLQPMNIFNQLYPIFFFGGGGEVDNFWCNFWQISQFLSSDIFCLLIPPLARCLKFKGRRKSILQIWNYVLISLKIYQLRPISWQLTSKHCQKSIYQAIFILFWLLFIPPCLNIVHCWGEWPNGLRRCDQNWKVPGSSPTRRSAGLRDPALLQGSW